MCHIHAVVERMGESQIATLSLIVDSYIHTAQTLKDDVVFVSTSRIGIETQRVNVHHICLSWCCIRVCVYTYTFYMNAHAVNLHIIRASPCSPRHVVNHHLHTYVRVWAIINVLYYIESQPLVITHAHILHILHIHTHTYYTHTHTSTHASTQNDIFSQMWSRVEEQ